MTTFDLPVLGMIATGEEIGERELIRILVYGSQNGVKEVQRDLHALRYREMSTWSPIMPTPTPNIVMSINTHYRRAN
ncbi:MAG TPA: hypothetical protein V6C65_10505 [Allocoleopsis sp.]